MLKAEQIPPDAMYAAWKCLSAGMTLNEAIAAAINAWPGMEYDPGALVTDAYRDLGKIILPLPQEASDD